MRPLQGQRVRALPDAGLELGNLRVLLRRGRQHLLARTRDGGLDRALALALGAPLARRQLALELGVAHLAHDLRVLRLVDLEDLAAVRALDLCHDSPVLLVLP